MVTSLRWYGDRACNLGYLFDVLANYYLNGNSIQNFMCILSLNWTNRRGRVGFDKTMLNHKTEKKNWVVELRPFFFANQFDRPFEFRLTQMIIAKLLFVRCLLFCDILAEKNAKIEFLASTQLTASQRFQLAWNLRTTFKIPRTSAFKFSVWKERRYRQIFEIIVFKL